MTTRYARSRYTLHTKTRYCFHIPCDASTSNSVCDTLTAIYRAISRVTANRCVSALRF